MLKPILNHQKEIKDLHKKMDFLRESFDFGNADAFFEELYDISKEMKNELAYHFNLQQYSYGENEKAKKIVLENMLVKDMLLRMLDFIIKNAYEKKQDAFIKLDDFDEILKAYLKKEKGLFIQELRSVLSENEIEECEKKLSSLV